MSKLTLEQFKEKIRHDDPLERAVYLLLKAEEMRYKNIPDKFKKQIKLINEVRELLDSWETGI